MIILLTIAIPSYFIFNTKKTVPKKPELAVNKPKYVDKNTLVITGTTDAGNTVIIDGTLVPVNEDGSFSLSLTGDQIGNRIMQIVATNNQNGLQTVDEEDIVPYNPNPTVASVTSQNSVENTTPQQAQQTQTASPPQASTPKTPPPTASAPMPATAPPKRVNPPSLSLRAPAYSKDNHVTVTGTSSPGAVIIFNGSSQITVGPSGEFSTTIVFKNQGTNQISAIASFPSLPYNTTTRSLSVIVDSVPPAVKVQYKDSLGYIVDIPTATDQNKLVLYGTVTDYSSVTLFINSQPITINNSTFTYTWNLDTIGSNTLTIVAKDALGTTTTLTKTIQRN